MRSRPVELLDPTKLTHVIVSPRLRAQRTAQLLFEGVTEEEKQKMNWQTTEECGEWKYGAYEGLLVRSLATNPIAEACDDFRTKRGIVC